MDSVESEYEAWMNDVNPQGGYWAVGLAVWRIRQFEIDELKLEIDELKHGTKILDKCSLNCRITQWREGNNNAKVIERNEAID